MRHRDAAPQQAQEAAQAAEGKQNLRFADAIEPQKVTTVRA
jgi:hypothetical protein